jgi:hypothetical protein
MRMMSGARMCGADPLVQRVFVPYWFWARVCLFSALFAFFTGLANILYTELLIGIIWN